MRMFDGTFAELGTEFYDPNFDNVTHIIRMARDHFYHNIFSLQFTLNRDIEVLPDSVTGAYITWMEVFYGRPLPGYDSPSANESAQGEAIRNYLINTVRPILDPLARNGIGRMKVTYYHRYLESEFLEEAINGDIIYLVTAFVFIAVFMMLQTQSLLISNLSILVICSSLFTTNLIYHFVFSQTFIGPFNLISLFYVFGITSDDIFLFYDAWRESARYQFSTLASRVTFCYRRISFANTLSSAVGFMTMTTSPLVIIRSFGIFTTILVLLNLLLLYTVLPIIVVFYHKHFEHYDCLCCCENDDYEVNYHSENSLNKTSTVYTITRSLRQAALSHRLMSTAALVYRKVRVSRIRRLFAVFFEFQFRLVSNLIAGCVLLVTFSVLTVVFIVYASRLRQNGAQVSRSPSGIRDY